MNGKRFGFRLYAVRRGGFTLPELLAVMVASALLLGGMASAIMIASRALPDGEDPATSALEAFGAVGRLTSELPYALSITQRTPTGITFTVADRDNDALPETIAYQWSGTAGDPLTRSYNGQAPVAIADNVEDFSLSYDYATTSEMVTETVETMSDEVELASFFDWASVAATNDDLVLTSTNWGSQYISIVVPPDSRKLEFTRVALNIGSTLGSVLLPVTVSMHRSLNDGSYLPDPTPIGTPVSDSVTRLALSTQFHTFYFNGAVVNDPERTDYCLLVRGDLLGTLHVRRRYHSNPPGNGTYHRWTTDGGASWLPAIKDVNKWDMQFFLYGRYGTTTTQEVEKLRYFLKLVEVRLRLGGQSVSSVHAACPVHNLVEVASP